jgi:imidazolonepropionase-like amidohydrolase
MGGRFSTITLRVTRISGRHAFVASILLLFGCKPASNDGVALVGATLIDGTGGPALPDAVVVVRRGRIESVGTHSDFQLPPKTREVDLSGRWIIPGLIDSHAHLAPSLSWARPRYLVWGVTTIRDMHGGIGSLTTLRTKADEASANGPRVYAAGAMIDGLPATYPDAIGVSSDRDARKAVDRLVTAGADFIKVYTRIDAPLLRAIIDEAKAFNLSVSGHLGMTNAVAAAKAGIGSIEHMTGIAEAATTNSSAIVTAHYRGFYPGWTAAERSWAALDSAAVARVAQTVAEAKVTVVPTLVLHETLSRLNEPGLMRDQALQDVPDERRQEWDVPGLISRAGWSGADFEAFRRSRAMQDFFVRAFAEAGGRIAAGTDAVSPMLVPGYSEHVEMELLVRAGLTAREALRAATRNGAVLLDADSLGLLAPGNVADLVVLSKDPLADIRNSRAIESVMSRGRLMSTDSIRATW